MKPGDTVFDAQMMRTACATARAAMGATSPNPAVGAVACDAEGRILAAAATQRAGLGHAEANTLALCREQGTIQRIHTLYTTLEPCNHHGRTPPCSEAIIAAGIKRVVIGTRDPNPAASGGIEHLQQAGIEIVTGVEEQECRLSLHAFLSSVQTGKPWITIKRAFDAEGSMIPVAGQKTFTSPESLRLAHRMRKKADAVLTGSGTVLGDKPLFTVRHVQDHPGKRRGLAVIDRRGRVPATYLEEAASRGFDTVIHRDAAAAIADLAAKGAQDILVEAGPALSRYMFDAGLWTMSVEIHKGAPDKINVDFNPQAPILFEKQAFRWEHFLPQERQDI